MSSKYVLTGAERETVLLMNDEDDTCRISTSQRKWIGNFRRKGFTEVEQDEFGIVTFEIPASSVNISIKTTRNLSPEQREVLAARLRGVRK